ncbi:MAG: hypothetical protein OD814_000480 [Candidatus Alkanophagales archaeon MCA70_species_1]|nr:hypothetical protein [Candidatus Alkanophaga volatiphilum]
MTNIIPASLHVSFGVKCRWTLGVSTEMLELQKWKEAKLPKLSSEVELRYIHQRTGEEVYGGKYGFDLEFFNRKMEWALVIGLGKENLFL